MAVKLEVTDAIHHRRDLGRLLVRRGLTQHGAEVGVYRGEFARMILRRWPGVLFCVDPWANPPGYKDDPASEGDREADYEFCQRWLEEFGNRVVYVRETSVQAAAGFPDRWFDFVYIDADHRREQVLADCRAWAPKVKNGGLLCGHDITGLWRNNVEPAVVEFADEAGISTVGIIKGDAPHRLFPPFGDAASWFMEL